MKRLYNLARMTTATTGTGTITLGSAATGCLSFASAGIANGDIVSYAISDGAASEIGYGTYTSAGTTLTRNVTKSTNSNSPISLSGTAQVFITPRAEDLMNPLPCITMYPAENQGSGAWIVIDAFGVPVNTAGTTTQGLQEAITASKTLNQPLVVSGRGTITCTTALSIPNIFLSNIYMGPEVTVSFGALGSAACVTIDSQENGKLNLLAQFTQNGADTGDVILMKPTNAVPGTGNLGAFASQIDFGTIVPASAGASALHLDSTNGNIDGIRTNIIDINGGVTGLKLTVSASTPHVIQEVEFTGQYWHGMSGFGIQVGTSTTNSNFLRRNKFNIGRISPNANAAVGFSSYGQGDIIDICSINAEEAPGGANLANGIVWQSGATGNVARVGQIATGTGAAVLNSSGNNSNRVTLAGAFLAGGGSGGIQPQGQLTAQVSSVGTAANTTETDLQTYSMPANTFDVVGRGIRVTAWGSYGATANGKTVKAYFGSGNIYNSGVVSQNGTAWLFEAEIYKTGSNAQTFWANFIASNSNVGVGGGNATQTDTAAITVKITGTNSVAAANDILCRGMSVKMIN